MKHLSVIGLTKRVQRSWLISTLMRFFAPLTPQYISHKGESHHPQSKYRFRNIPPPLLLLFWIHPLLWSSRGNISSCSCGIQLSGVMQFTPPPSVSHPITSAPSSPSFEIKRGVMSKDVYFCLAAEMRGHACVIHNVIPGLACQAFVTLQLLIDTAGGAEMGVTESEPPQPPISSCQHNASEASWCHLASTCL